MNAVVVPVRSISDAKRRLSDCLTSVRREQLALSMLADMVREIARSAAVDRLVVVTSDDRFLVHASELGAEVFDEGEAGGLNAAVSKAAQQLERQGVARALIIPGDVPLIQAAEINVLFATDSRRFPVVIVPSLSGEGTNGLLLSPPSVLQPRFEGASRSAHRDECTKEGLRFLELDLDGFKLDIDTVDDLVVLKGAPNSQTAELLRSWRGLILPGDRALGAESFAPVSKSPGR